MMQMLFFQSIFCSNELKWIKIFNSNPFSFAENIVCIGFAAPVRRLRRGA